MGAAHLAISSLSSPETYLFIATTIDCPNLSGAPPLERTSLALDFSDYRRLVVASLNASPPPGPPARSSAQTGKVCCICTPRAPGLKQMATRCSDVLSQQKQGQVEVCGPMLLWARSLRVGSENGPHLNDWVKGKRMVGVCGPTLMCQHC